ncbi:hypothetical protein ACVIHI_008739 [Bradyrhizobium sp. USDA 4524]|uniref:hypothetical protein n=1 Tax=unclassified Bradyrhizobium TaxID=2631580 RepID=UPI00209EC2C1|nr:MULTISPECIES: hypothetical protein [unclassified Bradyrhizobium]MCP1845797.1 hypothetical protein [Bradyrhizobium sp. USDA 4538]MCP1906880.1 hypothetical protein [Bradyrhizobium sp. USDA 4537]MCP1985355.1 hypothetical protein [Bradyrhizobium sp. USDA 4539]
MSLDDLNAELLALEVELRQLEEARNDALKTADEPTAEAPGMTISPLPPTSKF